MLSIALLLFSTLAQTPRDNSPLDEKAALFYRDLLEEHFEDGLYVSIVPVLAPGEKHTYSTAESGNVIHAGVWTGRYLGGVGYRYAVTKDPAVRRHGGEVLAGLRRLQEVTGKPGLLARGYVRGNGPVEGWERDGRDSTKWHQGQGAFAGYRFYSDVSVDNFNAVLYGYAIYFDLAADEAQKKIIAHDVDRLMTHVLDNNCRIIDLDGKVTQYGHIGMDPSQARDDYYRQLNAAMLRRNNTDPAAWRPPLRSSLMLLPDLLIAYHVTGKERYRDFYRRVIERFKDNPDRPRDTRPFSLERVAGVNHSSEGQAYEALFNLIRYERDPELRKLYLQWLADLWDMNWMEGNALFTYMTLAIAPEMRWPIRDEAVKLAEATLRGYPVNRVFRPIMNSLRADVARNPAADRGNALQAAKPVPIQERPMDNEYTWKGNPYALDGWLKPQVTTMTFSSDDPKAAWFTDSSGHLYRTLDGWKTWQNASETALSARIEDVVASHTRSYVLYARSDRGVLVTRDGGMSWRMAGKDEPAPDFPPRDFSAPAGAPGGPLFRIRGQMLERTTDGGATFAPAMTGWRIPRADSFFVTPRGVLASGPGGVYLTKDGVQWTEQKFWREEETGASDFLDAYWMGRYYKLLPPR